MDKPKRKPKPDHDFYFNTATFFRRYGVAIFSAAVYMIFWYVQGVAFPYPDPAAKIDPYAINRATVAVCSLGGCFVPIVILALFFRMVTVSGRRELQSWWDEAIYATIYVILMLWGMFLIAITAGFTLTGAEIKFGESVIVDNAQYRLAKLYEYDDLGYGQYLVYECDLTGVNCQLIHESSSGFSSADLNFDENKKQLVLNLNDLRIEVIDLSARLKHQ